MNEIFSILLFIFICFKLFKTKLNEKYNNPKCECNKRAKDECNSDYCKWMGDKCNLKKRCQ